MTQPATWPSTWKWLRKKGGWQGRRSGHPLLFGRLQGPMKHGVPDERWCSSVSVLAHLIRTSSTFKFRLGPHQWSSYQALVPGARLARGIRSHPWCSRPSRLVGTQITGVQRCKQIEEGLPRRGQGKHEGRGPWTEPWARPRTGARGSRPENSTYQGTGAGEITHSVFSPWASSLHNQLAVR